MAKFITDILKFILLVIPVYLIGIFIWGSFLPQALKPNLQYIKGAYGFMNTRIKEVQNIDSTEILILGSSHAYRGFDVRIFQEAGYSTFNLGSSAQSPIQTLVLLNRYLQTINPKLIIYEVYPSTFCTDGVESALDIISNDKNDFYSLQMVLKTHNIKAFNTLMYAYMNDFFKRNDDFIESKITKNDIYVNGGYVERKITYNSPQPQTNRKWQFKNSQLEAFSEIIDFLNQNNIPTVLIMAPITKGLYLSYDNMHEFEEIINQTNKRYINFNDFLELDDSLHFYDNNHLNQHGVQLFNHSCIDTLRELNILK